MTDLAKTARLIFRSVLAGILLFALLEISENHVPKREEGLLNIIVDTESFAQEDILKLATEIEKLPEPLYAHFSKDGWKITLSPKRLENESSGLERGRIVGMTYYSEKEIHIAEPQYLLHEIGHFVWSTISTPEEIEALFREEGSEALLLLGQQASVNAREYFAEYFAAWISSSDAKRKALQNKTPETYQYFIELEAASWQR